MNGLDSVLFFKAAEDGEYILQVRDFRYQAGVILIVSTPGRCRMRNQSFRLRGQSVEVALAGRNLEGTSKMNLNIAGNAPRGRQDIRANTPKGYYCAVRCAGLSEFHRNGTE